MLPNMNPIESTLAQDAPKKSSTVRKLIRAAALATALLPLGAVAAEAVPMTYLGPEFPGGGDDTNDWDFGDFSVRIQILGMSALAEFDLDTTVSPTDDAALAGFLPAGVLCVPLDLGYPTPSCWLINVATVGLDPGEWGGGGDTYEMTVAWLGDTDAMFPDPRLYHDTGSGFADITTEYFPNGSPSGPFPKGGDPSCYPDCGGYGLSVDDPAIAGADNDFSIHVIGGVPASVPEPATLMLLAGALGGLVYRRRRQNRKS